MKGRQASRDQKRLNLLRKLCGNMAHPIRDTVNGIKEEIEVVEIKLQDEHFPDWNSCDGRPTLTGGAAQP